MMRDTSSRSSTSCACARALRSSDSSARCRIDGCMVPSRSMCAQPSTALSGVRSSWDRVARNSSFSRFASSAVRYSRALSRAMDAHPATPDASSSWRSVNTAWLRVPEEQPAEHDAASPDHRNGEIAPDRQVARGHAVVGSLMPVARILRHVVEANDGLAPECRSEDLRRARLRKAREGLPRRAGQRVEKVGIRPCRP